MYIRFCTTRKVCNASYNEGVFQAAFYLINNDLLFDYEEKAISNIIEWFNDNLEAPDWFSRSKKPHAHPHAVSWFKCSATEHIKRMRELCCLLEVKGIEVTSYKSTRVGYLVYEDDYQVAAEPFADTFNL